MAEWVALGDRAIRFARPTGLHAQLLVTGASAWPGVTDVVVTREHVAVYFAGTPQVSDDQLAALAAPARRYTTGRTHQFKAVYDGPDLEAVSAATVLSIDDIIIMHRAAQYRVEMMGFLPGFAYLSGLHPRLEVPRRATPRTRVPANSIAIAAGYTSVYPLDSPGGWHLIGRIVDAPPLFGAEGTLLKLGDDVRFES